MYHFLKSIINKIEKTGKGIKKLVFCLFFYCQTIDKFKKKCYNDKVLKMGGDSFEE